MAESIETVVVGAGPAGLAASYHLLAGGREHVVLERGRVGETWHTQRWDSFRAVTPAGMMGLPGAELGTDARAFPAADEFVDFLDGYVRAFRLPVRERVGVRQVAASATGWHVTTTAGDVEARNVVIASGAQRVPRIPGSAQRLPRRVLQLHSADYRRARDLPAGGVLVVGAAQTGAQIAEELLEHGRAVYLCASRVGRVPRRYRGRDMLEWWRDTGYLDERTEELRDRAVFEEHQPLVSGVRGGHSLSLQQLRRDGAVLVGRLRAVHGDRIQLAGDLAASIRFGDDVSAAHRRRVDEFVAEHALHAPPPQEDPADVPDPDLPDLQPEIDLREAGVNTVIWCTGFEADLHFVPRALRPRIGRPPSTARGLYAVGFPWLRSRKSGLIWGFGDDAEWVAHRIATRARRAPTRVP